MSTTSSPMAQQLAQAACEFEQRRSGQMPKTVSVVISERTLVVTLHGTLPQAETVLAKTPAGAMQMQESHRQMFATSSEPLRAEIRRITGVGVSAGSSEMETVTGAVMQMFASGTVVLMFSLDQAVPADSWSGSIVIKQK